MLVLEKICHQGRMLLIRSSGRIVLNIFFFFFITLLVATGEQLSIICLVKDAGVERQMFMPRHYLWILI